MIAILTSSGRHILTAPSSEQDARIRSSSFTVSLATLEAECLSIHSSCSVISAQLSAASPFNSFLSMFKKHDNIPNKENVYDKSADQPKARIR